MQTRLKLAAAIGSVVLISAAFAENAVGPNSPPTGGSSPGQTSAQQPSANQNNQQLANQASQQQSQGQQQQPNSNSQTAQGVNANSPSQAQALDESSKNLVRDLLIGTQMQVKLSEAAQQKSQNDSVKQFAQQLLNTTRPGVDKIRTFATEHGVQVENDLTGKHKAVVDAATAQQGPAFDQMYTQIITMQLDDLANKFQQQQGQAKDPAIQQLIQSGLPAIKQYQQQAQQLAQQSRQGQTGNSNQPQAQGGAGQTGQAAGGNLQQGQPQSQNPQQQQSQAGQAQQGGQQSQNQQTQGQTPNQQQAK